MIRIIWTREAALDLKIIYLFYLPLNAKAAKDIYTEIRTEAKRLNSFPKLGMIEPLLTDKEHTARSLIIRKTFKLIYFSDKNNIYITNVWDCRRNPEVLKNEIRH